MAASKPNKKPNPPLDTNTWSNDTSKLQGSASTPPIIVSLDFGKAIQQYGIGPGGAIDPSHFVARGGAIDPSHFKDSPTGKVIGDALKKAGNTAGNVLNDANKAANNLANAGANTSGAIAGASQGLQDISKYLPYIIIGIVVLLLLTVGKNSGVTISK